MNAWASWIAISGDGKSSGNACCSAIPLKASNMIRPHGSASASVAARILAVMSPVTIATPGAWSSAASSAHRVASCCSILEIVVTDPEGDLQDGAGAAGHDRNQHAED